MKRIMKADALQTKKAWLATASSRHDVSRQGSLFPGRRATYRARAQKMMMRMRNVKILAIPRAKQRIMDRTPSLD